MRRHIIAIMTLGLVVVGCGGADLTEGEEASSDVVENGGTPENADADSVEPVPEPQEETSPEPEPEPVEPTEPAPEQQDLEVTDSGFSTFTAYDDSTRASWAVVLSNPNEDVWLATSIDVTVTLLDEAGTVLASASESLPILLPGQSGAVTGTPTGDMSELTDIRVQARVRNWEQEDGPFGSFETSGITVRSDDFGGWTVTGEVASSFTDDFEDVYGVAVFRDADDQIVGGTFTFLDFVPGGGDTSFQIDLFDDLEDVDSADVYVSLSNLSLW